MCKRQRWMLLLAVVLLVTQAGCWSSKEIEDLSIYTGLAMDKGELSPVEKSLEEAGGSYEKRNTLTATLQFVPKKSFGSANQQGGEKSPMYINVSETGDSIFEIFRQFSIRLDRPIIGHHLKVIVISSALAQSQDFRMLMDFMLRDNDIRPSALIFLSKSKASETFVTRYTDEIPSFRIRDMTRNRYRSSKVLKGITLSELDRLIHSERSYVLQNIVQAKGELEFSGGGIIKGETGKWIGNLNQHDVESIAWIKGDIGGGAIKAYDRNNQPLTYEIKSAKSKITAKISDGEQISFHVKIKSEGRLIEKWSEGQAAEDLEFVKKVEKIYETRLLSMIDNVMKKMQSEYVAEVAGFGEWLSIEKPQLWKKLKDHWDEKFSQIPVTFEVKCSITDFGSFTE